MKKIFILIVIIIQIISVKAWIQYSWDRAYFEPPSENNIFCNIPVGIKCLDSNDCIAVLSCGGAYIKILKSYDQGESWNILYQDTINLFFPHYAIAYPSKNYVYCGGNFGSILRTYDGFKTVDTTMLIYFKAEPSGPIVRDLIMGDSLNGIANTDGRFYITKTGWRTYEWIQSPWYYPFKSGYFFDSLNFLVLFQDKRPYPNNPLDSFKLRGIARTTDGGKHWHEFILPGWAGGDVISSIYGIHFHNKNLGFAVGFRGNGIGNQQSDLIYRTTDGGFNWEKIYDKELDPKFGLYGICFRDSLYGIAVGAWGKVLETTDGGNTWQQINFPFAANAPVLTCAFAGQFPIIGTYGFGIWKMYRYEISNISEQLIPKNTSILIYPNPFYESTTIMINYELEEPIEIEIYDSMGLLLQKYRVEYPKNEIKFTANNKNSGVYFYRIKTSNKIISGSFVKLP